jgi:HAD superfamily hydrolase (TIGR01509 family)
MQRFVGHTVKSQRATIEAHTGQPLTDAWLEQFFSRRNERLTQSITAIEGVHEAVAHLHAHCQGSIAVASGADRFKVEMMLKQVGLIGFFEGRIFSGHEMPRSKPHPDVYLAAAAHLRVDPARCLVVEDTTVGITAGVAAGATVWAYAAPPAAHEPLVQAGAARVFTAMGDLRLV